MEMDSRAVRLGPSTAAHFHLAMHLRRRMEKWEPVDALLGADLTLADALELQHGGLSMVPLNPKFRLQTSKFRNPPR